MYLKEGRIGKKETRDRKTKIVNTLLVAAINPLNPLESSITPYVEISEVKAGTKEMNNQELISEAIQKAQEHM